MKLEEALGFCARIAEKKTASLSRERERHLSVFLPSGRRKAVPSFLSFVSFYSTHDFFLHSFTIATILSLYSRNSRALSCTSQWEKSRLSSRPPTRARNLNFTFSPAAYTSVHLGSSRLQVLKVTMDRLEEPTKDPTVNEIYTRQSLESRRTNETSLLSIWSARLTTRIIMASRGSLSLRGLAGQATLLSSSLWWFMTPCEKILLVSPDLHPG